MKNWLLKNKLLVIGICIGALGGYTYYYFVGCTSGTCMITSQPINSTLYGSLMGGLFFSIFNNKKS